MRKTFTTTKTLLLAILLVLLVCCLTITLALTCQQNEVQAEGQPPVISADELPDEDSSGDYPFMTIAEVTVSDEENIRKQFAEAATGTVIKLGANITFTKIGAVSLNRANVELTLDLNGKTLTGLVGADVVTVGDSTATLNIIDSSGNNSGKVFGGNYALGLYLGSLNLYGGTITGANGGANLFATGSQFIMYDGVITDNVKNCGVNINTGATFTMKGGNITNNKGTYGGGVYILLMVPLIWKVARFPATMRLTAVVCILLVPLIWKVARFQTT